MKSGLKGGTGIVTSQDSILSFARHLKHMTKLLAPLTALSRTSGITRLVGATDWIDSVNSDTDRPGDRENIKVEVFPSIYLS